MRSRVSNRIAIGGLAALACLFAAASVARADDYPSRVVTLVVPYPPGGGVDAMARVVAQKLSDAFHQQVIVDNKAGAGGTLGTRAVAHAAPDGYTLLLGHTGTISINPSLYAHPGYDPRKDFAPVGLVNSRNSACAPPGDQTARQAAASAAPRLCFGRRSRGLGCRRARVGEVSMPGESLPDRFFIPK